MKDDDGSIYIDLHTIN